MISKRLLAAVLVTLLSPTLLAGTHAQDVKLYPFDEASKDPSFKRFRDKLIVAVKKRDKWFLLSILHPKVLNSFGGDGGIPEFVSKWNLNSPDSKVWSELLTVLSLGGSFSYEGGQKMFEAPYVSSRWDLIQPKLPSELGEVSYEVVIKKNVPVHPRPDDDAPVMTWLTYDVVEVDYEGSVRESPNDDNFRWVKVKTLRGHQGYIRGPQLRSPVGLRAGFTKIKGKWVMNSFVGGD